MANNLHLEYVTTAEFLIIKIMVSDYRGPPYETTRTMIPWNVINRGVRKAMLKARKAAAKKKAVKAAPVKRTVSSKRRAVKPVRKRGSR